MELQKPGLADTVVSMTGPAAIPEADAARRPHRWLLLIHQLPPSPAYLRVKIRRRLKQLGAQLLKNSVYVLPNSAEAAEDLHWLRREILDAGGEATVTLADFVEGASDMELEDRFRKASDAEYAEFARAVRAAEGPLQHRDALRIRSQLGELTARDFFAAGGRGEAERALTERLPASQPAAEPLDPASLPRPAGATWVTRADVHVDRMASAWLITRFIDPAATFKFVTASGYQPSTGEVRFDMFDGEYTHGKDRCTFQTLVWRFGLAQPALEAMGEVIHDIDYKVEQSHRHETEGIRVLVRGIGLSRENDHDRVEAARPVFDGLYAYFAQAR
jgi:hypothetical protein